VKPVSHHYTSLDAIFYNPVVNARERKWLIYAGLAVMVAAIVAWIWLVPTFRVRKSQDDPNTYFVTLPKGKWYNTKIGVSKGQVIHTATNNAGDPEPFEIAIANPYDDTSRIQAKGTSELEKGQFRAQAGTYYH
jgi:hypothetical protein